MNPRMSAFQKCVAEFAAVGGTGHLLQYTCSNCHHVTQDNRPYYMGENILELVDQERERDLWIVISSDLKYSRQCLYAYNKANNVLDMIRRTIKIRGHCLKLRKTRRTKDITR